MDRYTPTLVSPPDITTPPYVATTKRNHSNGESLNSHQRDGSEAIDAAALSDRLEEFKHEARVREVTPSGSPSRKRPRLYADRSVASLALDPSLALHDRGDDLIWTLRTMSGRARASSSKLILTSCRFIPDRNGQDLRANFNLLPDEISPTTPSRAKRRPANGELHFQKSKLKIVWVVE